MNEQAAAWRRPDRASKLKLGALIAGTAVLSGVLAGLYGALFAFGVVGAIAFVIGLVRDYRVGLVASMAFTPFIGLSEQGANVFLLLVFSTLIVFVLGKMLTHKPFVGLPTPVWIGMILVVAWGAFLEVQHLDEARHALSDTQLVAIYSVKGFLIFSVFIPFSIVLIAWMLANAVRESSKPEFFIGVFAVISSAVALHVLQFVATSSFGLAQLADSRNREVFGQLGHHANEFGPMLAVAAAPFLFLTADSKGWKRVIYATVLLMLAAACALVFSRGGYLAFIVIFGAFLIWRRSLKLYFAVGALCVAAVLAAPEAIIDRATTGLDSRSLAMTADRSEDDPLTAGRFSIYEMFWPDIEASPILGSGTGSAAWSAPVRSGRTLLLHPHNTYLRVVMDVGLLGLVLLAYFWRAMSKQMRALSRDATLAPAMRSFFSGATAGVFGYLTACISGGPHWLPDPGQPFMWFAIGMALAFWPVTVKVPKHAAMMPDRMQAQQRPANEPSTDRSVIRTSGFDR